MYIIEAISDHRELGNRNEYLVAWEESTDQTWEPTSALAAADALRNWKNKSSKK